MLWVWACFFVEGDRGLTAFARGPRHSLASQSRLALCLYVAEHHDSLAVLLRVSNISLVRVAGRPLECVHGFGLGTAGDGCHRSSVAVSCPPDFVSRPPGARGMFLR